MRRDPDLAMVTVFGLGYLRPAPGTWGSLPSVCIAAALIALGLGPAAHPAVYWGLMAVLVLVFSGACVTLGDRAEARFWKKDPSQVVADETAGQAVTLLFVPSAATVGAGRAAMTLIGAFLAFRLMDIVKPWPARQIQRVPAGWGVVLDDLVAGVYGGVLVWVAAWAVMR